MLRGTPAISDEIRALYSAGALGALADDQLLALFTIRRGEVSERAFAVLVERHGPMVLGVCRRLLPDHDAAADAFQATFLVLVQRAASVRVTDSLGRWLYGVSRRVALQARAAAGRRDAHERTGLHHASVACGDPGVDRDRSELLGALDEEIARLPEKYRQAIVLCDLGGMTHQAAAVALGRPVGTIESRLSRGRERLRRRLTWRGVAPAAVGALLGSRAAAAVSSLLSQATVEAAIRLTPGRPVPAGLVSASVSTLVKGAERAMVLSRVKITAGLLIATSILGAGAGVLVGQERRDGPAVAGAAAGSNQPGFEDRSRLAALEERLRALERRLDQLRAPTPLAFPDGDLARKIRPRFECVVERIAVKIGQTVHKGDPLAELFSVDLAAAKNEYLAKTIQRNHATKLVAIRQKLVGTGAMPQQVWVDTENDDERSRHELSVARDRLELYGLSPNEIDAVNHEDGEQKARFTLRSPVEGHVVEVGIAAGELADPRSTLMVIGQARP
jgi:RNA polymerase sigma factor (sigma-70 family)